MSIFKVDAGVGNPDGSDLAPIRPVVDTGAPIPCYRNPC